MKNRSTYLGLLSLGAAVIGAAVPLHVANAANEGANAQALQVEVNLPPSWLASLEGDFVSEQFFDQVASKFRRMGFEGKVEYAAKIDQRMPDDYRLEVQIIEWRLNAVGNVDCSFTARLLTPRGERSLGVYSAAALHSIMGRGRLWLGDSFEEAANMAIADLYNDLAEAELIPGLRNSS